MTPDAQDLKEEVRANLVARVDELEAAGVAPEAARRAIAELGDRARSCWRDDGASHGATSDRYAAMQLAPPRAAEPGLRRARGRVVRCWPSTGIALAILGAAGVLPLPVGALIAGLSGSHRRAWPARRRLALAGDDDQPPDAASAAGGYFLATFLGVYGLGIAALVLALRCRCGASSSPPLGVIASIILFAFLGATQTNRHKAWTREQHERATSATGSSRSPRPLPASASTRPSSGS